MTGRMLEGIEALIQQEQPDWVLVYGDTNSTLAGALAAAKLHVSVAHVEAGLRSHNPAMPEEINRVLTDRISTLLCAQPKPPCTTLKEGFPSPASGTNKAQQKQYIENIGDVMYDAVLYYRELASERVRLSYGLNTEAAPAPALKKTLTTPRARTASECAANHRPRPARGGATALAQRPSSRNKATQCACNQAKHVLCRRPRL